MNEHDQCTPNRYFSANPLSCNWFNIVEPRIIADLPAIELATPASPLSDRRAIKAAFRSFGIVTNEADGLMVTFPAASAGKMLYQSGTDIRAIASSFKLLFEKSMRAWDEKEVPMTGHKFHFNVSAYSNYISKFRMEGVEYFVRFTIRKIGRDSSVHASTISEVAIYRKTEGIPADSHPENPEDGHRMPFIDNKIAFFLSACQLSTASEKSRPSSRPHSHSNIHSLIALASRLHARLGDFWWYSLMIFMAARAADCLNVFVGLWLVPKYVPPSELGAVMPLTQFATFLALPVAALASTLRNEASNLSLQGEFGKLKSLLQGVFVGTAVFFVLALVMSHMLLPHFLERIRIAEGSLGLLIIVFSFISALSPVFSSPLQSLKKFKATTVISLVGAPIRLLTMIVTIPLRAISGYFVGQMSVPAFSILTSVIALRKELAVRAAPYWERPVVRRLVKMFLVFAACSILGGLSDLVQNTILRQRLPDIDSAAYYMVTRFTEISSFLSSTLVMTIFPFAAELAAKGRSTNSIVYKSFAAVVGTNLLLAIAFSIVGKQLLGILPGGANYVDFWWAIPWLIGINTFNVYGTLFLTAEMSANRFRSLFVAAPLNLLYPAALLLVTGQGYYLHLVTPPVAQILERINATSLFSMLVWMSAAVAIRFAIYLLYSIHVQKRHLHQT